MVIEFLFLRFETRAKFRIGLVKKCDKKTKTSACKRKR